MPAYTTVAELRQYLAKIPTEVAAPGGDALLQDCLDRARGVLDGALGASFFDAGAAWPAVSVQQVSTEPGVWLRLPAYQAASITQIVAVSGLTADTSAITDWVEDWDSGRGLLYRPNGWAGRYAVTAKWGYGPAPDALIELNLELAVNIWRSKDRGLFAEFLGAEGGGQIRYVGGLTREQARIISALRRTYVWDGLL